MIFFFKTRKKIGKMLGPQGLLFRTTLSQASPHFFSPISMGKIFLKAIGIQQTIFSQYLPINLIIFTNYIETDSVELLCQKQDFFNEGRVPIEFFPSPQHYLKLLLQLWKSFLKIKIANGLKFFSPMPHLTSVPHNHTAINKIKILQAQCLLIFFLGCRKPG